MKVNEDDCVCGYLYGVWKKNTQYPHSLKPKRLNHSGLRFPQQGKLKSVCDKQKHFYLCTPKSREKGDVVWSEGATKII